MAKADVEGRLNDRRELRFVPDPPRRFRDVARDQSALDEQLLVDIDADVEDRAGERLRERVLVVPAGGEFGELDVVAREPDLIMRRQFGETVELVEDVKIAMRLFEEMRDQGLEVQRRDEGRRVGGRFLKSVIFASLRQRRRHADRRIDDEVPELMGHHIEVERVGNGRTVGLRMRADFHEAVTGIGVMKSGKNDDLELPVIAREMPIGIVWPK